MEDKKPKILFVGEMSVSDAVRCHLPGSHLADLDYEAIYMGIDINKQETPPIDPSIDIVVFSRPHTDTLLHQYKRYGIPVIVDMDDDFHTIPESHPGYQYVGKGNPIAIMKMENCIYAADLLTVTTKEMRNRMAKFNDNIMIIPNGWSSKNMYWKIRRRQWKDNLILGWAGTITHREDLQMLLPALKKILKSDPSIMISVGGDPEIYRQFAHLPPQQTLFHPMMPYSHYPLVVQYWDILLAPLADDEFNRAKSDIKLVDAGARGVPFIASDMPVYQGWDTGGLLVKDDQWYESIKYLIDNPDERKRLGKAGATKAKKREMSTLVSDWEKAIQSVWSEVERK